MDTVESQYLLGVILIKSGALFLKNQLLVFCAAVFILICVSPAFSQVQIQIENYERSLWDTLGIESIAVVDVTGNNQGTGERMSDYIADKITEQKFFRIKNRQDTNRELENAGIRYFGDIGRDKAAEISRALGVDGVIYGRVDASFYTVTRYRQVYRDYYDRDDRNRRRSRRVPYDEPYINRSGKVKIDLHFYSREKDDVIGSVNDEVSFYRDYEYRNYHSFPSDREMILRMFDEMVTRYVYRFTPHFVTRTRKLAGKDTEAHKAVSDGNWEKAGEIWHRELEENPDSYDVLRNLGIYHEYHGEINHALEYYKKALRIKPDDEELKIYYAQAENCDLTQARKRPVDVSKEDRLSVISKMESPERVFITLNKDVAISEGDTMSIVRKLPLFDDAITKITGERYFKIGVFKVEKLFEEVCLGSIKSTEPDFEVEEGDKLSVDL